MMSPTLYGIVVFVHVLAGVVLIGTSLLFPLTRGAMRSAQTGKELGLWIDHARRAHRANPLAALVLLATGLYLGSTGWWHAGWFYVSLVMFVVDSVLAAAVINPMGARLGKALAGAEGEIPPAADALRWSRTWDYAPDALLASDLAVLYAMLTKPSLAVTIGVVAGAFLLLFAYRARARRQALRGQASPGAAATPPAHPNIAHVMLVVVALGLACSPSQEELRSEGATTYATYCASCHAAKQPSHDAGGVPTMWAARDGAEIKDAILLGRAPGMPPFQRTLNDRQMRGLLVFLKSSPPQAATGELTRH